MRHSTNYSQADPTSIPNTSAIGISNLRIYSSKRILLPFVILGQPKSCLDKKPISRIFARDAIEHLNSSSVVPDTQPKLISGLQVASFYRY